MMNNSIITAITHRFILGTHIRQKLYQKIINGRFILGSTPLLIDNSIKQNTPCHANYKINSVIVGNINVAIRYRFILPINKKSVMLDMIQKTNTYRYIGKNTNGELVFNVDSKSSNKTYTIVVSITHDDSLSSVPTYQIRHEDEDECEGYKHRANCWHINDIQLDECCLCLTPFILKPARLQGNLIKSGVIKEDDCLSLLDQNGNRVYKNTKENDLYIHEECLKALDYLTAGVRYI